MLGATKGQRVELGGVFYSCRKCSTRLLKKILYKHFPELLSFPLREKMLLRYKNSFLLVILIAYESLIGCVKFSKTLHDKHQR